MDIVEKFCGFLAPDWGEFLDFIHLKGKIFHGGTVRRRAGRPEVAPGGLRRDFSGSGQRDFPGTPDVGNRGTTERDFGFVPIRGGGRLAELYAEPTTTGAAASGGQRVLLIRIVREHCRAALVPILPFR